MTGIEFHGCDCRSAGRILSCVKFDFDTIRSNVANGVAPVFISLSNEFISSPFSLLERDSDDSIQYLSVDKDSFNSLKSMVKDLDSEPNKKQLMLVTAQILLKNDYFVKKCKMPRAIYVYDFDEHYRYVREFSPENLNYLKYLPKPAKIEDNYTVDTQTAGRLDKIANILYNISLNKAILRLLKHFNVFASSEDNNFDLLCEALCNRQKTAEYKPSREFLENLILLSNEYSNARHDITLEEVNHPRIISVFFLKRMEFFLFLSQNFGYQIPQNLKTEFTSKINLLINTIKSVFSSYSRLKSGESLKNRFFSIKISHTSYNVIIDNIADDICSTPVSDDSEYRLYALSAGFLPGLITSTATIIGYKDNNSDFPDGNEPRIDAFCSRLQPLMQDSAKIRTIC